METWYVRPLKAGYYTDGTANDGTSYVNAWGGLYYSQAVDSFNYTNNTIFLGSLDGADKLVIVTDFPVWFSSSNGVFPTGIAANTVYYSIYSGLSELQIALAPGGAAIDLVDPTGVGTITVHQGAVWGLVSNGDTIYYCDNFNYDETIAINFHEMVSYKGGYTLDIPKSVIVRGDYAGHPGVIYSTTFKAIDGSWTDTGTNGVYSAGDVDPTGNWLVYENGELLNPHLARPTVTTPTAGELATFAAGDYAIASNYKIYLKPAASHDANPNNNVTVICSTGTAIKIGPLDSAQWPDGVDDVTVKNISIKGGGISICQSENCVIDNVDIQGAWIGISPTRNCSGLRIRNCSIDVCGDGGIYLGLRREDEISDDVIIENNTITRIGYDENGDALWIGDVDRHGIGALPGTNLIIRNNYIEHAGTGVTIYSDANEYPSGTGSSALSAEVYNNFTINLYNTLQAYMGAGIDHHGGPAVTVASGNSVAIKFYNNIVVNAVRSGIRMYPANQSNYTCEIYNNTVYNAATSFDFDCSQATYTYGAKFDFYNNISLSPTTYHWNLNYNTGGSGCLVAMDNNDYYPISGTQFVHRGTGYSLANFINQIPRTVVAPTAAMTSNSLPEPYVVTASREDDPAFRAFNGQNDQVWWVNGVDVAGQWIKLYVGATGVSPTSYAFISSASNTIMPKAWTLDGSNDDSTYTEIDSQTAQTLWAAYEQRIYTMDSPGTYKYFRLTISEGNNATQLGIDDIKFYVGDPFEVNSITTDPLFIDSTPDEAADCKLQASSPAIATGVAVTGVITDYAGNSYSNPPNIGAFGTSRQIETIKPNLLKGILTR